ncbi:hypothetical protein HXX76_003060 [Chlamydomonas incerta]|uniref:2-dehydropantoate 2-reductase n=1 Tax=Chlamydomonas incerta TaxID=51695 RepID=A0A835TCK4_CHLIN|nr:hypothetical protein HXX76_003060 [Chlamydomonas incerta]|eukprot:KAG2442987.1 hypothetical protein HXX76_003060 [Chlamydomonas incerta]
MTPTAPQRWHVLGAGSVGLLFAFYLRKAGHDVTLILRNEASVQSFKRASDSRVHLLERWRQPPASAAATSSPSADRGAAANGWQASEPLHAVSLPTTTTTSTNFQTSCPEPQPQRDSAQPPAAGASAAVQPIQRLVLATKAPDAVPALRSVLPHLAPDARCLLLQNGALAVADELRRELGEQLGLLAQRRRQLGGGEAGGGAGAGGGGGGGGGGGVALVTGAAGGIGSSRSSSGAAPPGAAGSSATGGGSTSTGTSTGGVAPGGAAAARGDVRLYLGSVTHGCYRDQPPAGGTAGLLPAPADVGTVATEPPAAGVGAAVATGAAALPVRGELRDGDGARGVVHAGRGAVTLGPLRPLLAALDSQPGLSSGTSSSSSSSSSTSGNSSGSNSRSDSSSSSSAAVEAADDAAFIAQLAAAAPELGIRAAAAAAAPGAQQATHPPPPLPPQPKRPGWGTAGAGEASPSSAASASAAATAQTAAAGALLRELHLKLAVNAAINPLGALLGVRNGRLAAGGRSRALMRAVCGELVAVFGAAAFDCDGGGAGGAGGVGGAGGGEGAGTAAQAARAADGIAAAEEEGQRQQRHDAEAAAERLFARVCAVAEATAANRCSMLADVDAGRRTEVDYLTGWVLAAAAARGLDAGRVAPTNRTLYELVKAKEEVAAGADTEAE